VHTRSLIRDRRAARQKAGKRPPTRPRVAPRRKAADLVEKAITRKAPPPHKATTADVGFAAVPAEKTVPIQIPELLQTSSQALDRSKEKTVTVKEAAYRLGKSEDAVYLWLRSGRLRGWQPGGRGCAILVAEASIAEAMCCSLGGRGKRLLVEGCGGSAERGAEGSVLI